MPKSNANLAGLYSQFLEKQGEEWRIKCVEVCRERQRALQRLKKNDVVTIVDLFARFPGLPASLKLSAIDLISILKIHQAVPVLIDSLTDRAVRSMCAD